MQSKNVAVIAAAGSRKTQYIIDAALAIKDEPVLITTYTQENQREIIRRLEQESGLLPINITVMGWFTFLIAQGARPYQRAVIGPERNIRGLNFLGARHRFAKRTEPKRFYLDADANLFRDGVSDFVWHANKETSGAVVSRLERIYRHVFIDEVQDLHAYDFQVLDLLLESRINVTAVGDPRQRILSTNYSLKKGVDRTSGIRGWFDQRKEICSLIDRTDNYRCNQAICEFADQVFPELPKSVSRCTTVTGHDGVFFIVTKEVPSYLSEHNPRVLRYHKTTDTMGLPALNIGKSKGQTYDRVLIFPTEGMRKFLTNRDPTKLKTREHLYVAATRARHSVAFVVPDRFFKGG